MINNEDKNKFLYPQNSYHGKIRPENIVFNANLQEFSQKISYICNLETGGRLAPHDAYVRIKSLWKELKRSKKALNIGEHSGQENRDS